MVMLCKNLEAEGKDHLHFPHFFAFLAGMGKKDAEFFRSRQYLREGSWGVFDSQ